MCPLLLFSKLWMEKRETEGTKILFSCIFKLPQMVILRLVIDWLLIEVTAPGQVSQVLVIICLDLRTREVKADFKLAFVGVLVEFSCTHAITTYVLCAWNFENVSWQSALYCTITDLSQFWTTKILQQSSFFHIWINWQ